MNKFIYFGVFLLGGTLFAVHAEPPPNFKVVIKEEKLVSHPDTTIKVADSQFGKVLTDSRGMTLYKFTDDKDGKSACTDSCAVAWPPFVVTEGKPVLESGFDGVVGEIVRTDGTKQVTFDGVPLYFYVKDKNAGDVTGHNVDGKWFVVTPHEK